MGRSPLDPHYRDRRAYMPLAGEHRDRHTAWESRRWDSSGESRLARRQCAPVFGIARRLLPAGRDLEAAAGTVFAVHPLRTEVVASAELQSTSFAALRPASRTLLLVAPARPRQLGPLPTAVAVEQSVAMSYRRFSGARRRSAEPVAGTGASRGGRSSGRRPPTLCWPRFRRSGDDAQPTPSSSLAHLDSPASRPRRPAALFYL